MVCGTCSHPDHRCSLSLKEHTSREKKANIAVWPPTHTWCTVPSGKQAASSQAAVEKSCWVCLHDVFIWVWSHRTSPAINSCLLLCHYFDSLKPEGCFSSPIFNLHFWCLEKKGLLTARTSSTDAENMQLELQFAAEKPKRVWINANMLCYDYMLMASRCILVEHYSKQAKQKSDVSAGIRP